MGFTRLVTFSQFPAFSSSSECPENSMCMAKGGKQNIQNEYTRMIQNSGTKDLCKDLRDLRLKEKNPQELRKIKQAEKNYGCDNKPREQ